MFSLLRPHCGSCFLPVVGSGAFPHVFQGSGSRFCVLSSFALSLESPADMNRDPLVRLKTHASGGMLNSRGHQLELSHRKPFA